MAVTKSTTVTALGGVLVVDPDADTTVETNVTGNTAGSIFVVDIDNSANATTAAYLHLVDAASASVSTTHTWMFYAPASQRVSYTMEDGISYSSGVSMWCSTGAAANNTGDPSGAVVVRLVAS